MGRRRRKPMSRRGMHRKIVWCRRFSRLWMRRIRLQQKMWQMRRICIWVLAMGTTRAFQCLPFWLPGRWRRKHWRVLNMKNPLNRQWRRRVRKEASMMKLSIPLVPNRPNRPPSQNQACPKRTNNQVHQKQLLLPKRTRNQRPRKQLLLPIPKRIRIQWPRSTRSCPITFHHQSARVARQLILMMPPPREEKTKWLPCTNPRVARKKKHPTMIVSMMAMMPNRSKQMRPTRCSPWTPPPPRIPRQARPKLPRWSRMAHHLPTRPIWPRHTRCSRKRQRWMPRLRKFLPILLMVVVRLGVSRT
mmetsp:Transcript_42711/g.78036  ORF Transcript_42711/g.78036 Transcript_42711/m.78036 type:complete len:302 (-) Transcript_42711:200-1105(-)